MIWGEHGCNEKLARSGGRSSRTRQQKYLYNLYYVLPDWMPGFPRGMHWPDEGDRGHHDVPTRVLPKKLQKSDHFTLEIFSSEVKRCLSAAERLLQPAARSVRTNAIVCHTHLLLAHSILCPALPTSSRTCGAKMTQCVFASDSTASEHVSTRISALRPNGPFYRSTPV